MKTNLKIKNITIQNILVMVINIFMFGLFLSACNLQQTQLKQIYCEKPVIECKPGNFNEISNDTTEEFRRKNNWKYRIEPVQKLNSSFNDWHLSFFSPRKALFTFDENNIQRVMIVRMVSPERFTIESGIDFGVEGHNGAAAFAGSEIFFANSENSTAKSTSDKNLLPLSEMIGSSRIYSAKFNNQTITDSKLLSETKDYFVWESHPSVTQDGNVMFFAADLPDGLGGTDIWFRIKDKSGKWGQPINCGKIINTTCDELSPFVAIDGKKLLFSSSGHRTVGGYDIFSSKIDDSFMKNIKIDNYLTLTESFSIPENLKFPVNTTADEILPTCPGDCDSIMYYSSNQFGKTENLISTIGGFDLFVKHKIVIEKKQDLAYEKEEKPVELKVDITPVIKDELVAIIPVYMLEGTVYDDKTRLPVPSAKIIINELDDNPKNLEAFTNEKGNYKIQLEKNTEYEITAHKEEYFYDTYKLFVDWNDTTTVIRKDFYIPEIAVIRINFPTDEYRNPYRFVLDSNGVETNRIWSEEIILVAKSINLSIDKIDKIILVGHTDDVGSVEYNNGLGERRVNFVISELIKQGVPKNILFGRSAGELEPISKRNNEDLTSYRKRLRRVTIEKILK